MCAGVYKEYLRGDLNLAALVLLGLGHDNAQNTLVEGGLDSVLVHASGEAERALEFSDAALRNPEF